jgi:hypothetical protein
MTNSLRAVLAATAFAFASRASGQTETADSSARRDSTPRRQTAPVLFAVIGGPGVETPTPYVFEGEDGIYQTQKRPMVFELEISRAVLVSDRKYARFEYFVAAQPVVTVGGNVRYHIGPCLRGDCSGRGADVYEQRYTSFGAGVTPIGLRLITQLPLSAKFSLSAAGGAVLLNKAIPYAQAKRANFQVTARPAIGFPISRHGTFWAGYELFHMSNGNTSPINPGINAGLVMFGFQRER